MISGIDRSEGQGASLRPSWWGRLLWSIGIGAAGLLLAVVLFVRPKLLQPVGSSLVEVLLASGTLLGLSALASSSTLKGSAYGKLINMAIAVTVIGALFKIQHWPGANVLVTGGMIAVLITYCFHYARKATKRASDHMKLGWGVTWIGSSLVKFLHLLSWADQIRSVSFLLLWTTMILFAWENRISNDTYGQGPVPR